MAIHDRMLSLVKKLDDKTKARKINWTKTSRDTEFQYSFSGGAVTTDFWFLESEGMHMVEVCVYNNVGVQSDRIAFSESEMDFSQVKEFYDRVVKSYLRSDETLDILFNDLDNT